MKTSALDARLAALLELDEDDRQKELTRLSGAEHKEFRYHWELFARRDQRPPPGDWTTWLICAGRGFGKTRAGAEWVREIAKRHDDARIALVGTSLAEVRAVMVEGESGIIACSPPTAVPTTSRRCGGWCGPTARRPCSIRPPSPNRCAGRNIAMPAGQARKEFFVNAAFGQCDALLTPRWKGS